MPLDNKQVEEVIEQHRLRREGSNGTNRFKKMLETHRPMPLRRGQIIEGEIIQLEENLAIIDVGAKRDAIVPPEEMDEVDESFLEQLDEGDDVHVYVTRTPIGDEDLLVSLEKGQREQDWKRAASFLENQEVLSLKVIGKNKGGLLVEFGRLQGFVPNSHVPALESIHDSQERMKTKSKMIHSTVSVKVLEIDRPRKRLVLSAKKARKELRQQRLLELKQKEGETISGRITNLVEFGAFVDMDGAEGLLHISEIAWQKVAKPAEILTPGDEIDVLIQSVDVKRERVSLSRKALLPNPWGLFAQSRTEGDLMEGVVTNVVEFGAFVRVDEGIEGLLHVSEMHGTQDSAPQDVLRSGDTILVRILDIQPQRQRLALSQRRISHAEQMEWIWQQQQASALPGNEQE